MTIDQRVVEMRFDNANFEKNVSSSVSALDKLKAALNFNGAVKGLDSVNQSVKGVNVSYLGEGVEKVSASFSALEVVAVSALKRITEHAVDAGAQLIASLSVDQLSAGWEKFGNKTGSVATLVAQGYDMDSVTEQLERLNWFTDETSYNFTDMVSNISKFTASGQDLTESVTAMEGIANWAALSGQNAETASRAMYQLSQAMGKGALKLDDYKSIQNASMDTDEFRQKSIDAAVALGKLRDVGNGVYETLNGHQFTKGQFTSFLSEDMWLDSDVMMTVFKQYSAAVDQIYEYASENDLTASEAIAALGDSVDEFGLKAFKAAQEARTLRDVLDSVKDAVSTGWMNTFEIIFGDYEEATALWTDLANEMWDVFAGGAEERNEMLSAWKELGGRDDLLEGFWAIWHSGVDILNAVKDGFHQVFPKATADRLFEITESFKNFAYRVAPTEERLQSISALVSRITSVLKKSYGVFKNVFGFVKDLAASIKEGIVNSGLGKFITGTFERFVDKLLGLTGVLRKTVFNTEEFGGTFDSMISIFTNVSTAIQNVIKRIRNIVQVAKSAFKSVFPESVTSVIENLIFKIEEITTKIAEFTSTKPNADSINFFIKLSGIFEGVFSAVDILKRAFSAFWKIVSPVLKDLFSVARKIGSFLLSVFAKIGYWISKFRVWAAETGFFDKIAERVVNAYNAVKRFFSTAKSRIEEFFKNLKEKLHIPELSTIKENIKAFVDTLKGKFETGGLDRIREVAERVKEKLHGAGNETSSFKESLIGFFTGIGEKLKNSKILEFLKTFWEFTKRIAGEIAGKLKTGFSAITEKLSGDGLSNAIEALKGLSLGGLVLVIKGFLDKLSNPVESLSGLFGNITDALDSVRGCFEAWQTKLKADALLKIAGAVLVLAISMIALSSVPEDKILGTFGAVTGLLAELLGSMALLGKMDKNQKSLKAVASGMLAVSASLLVVSLAVKQIAKVDEDRIGSAVLAVGVLVGIMVLAMNSLKSGDKAVKKVATAMVLFSAAVAILGSVASKFASMSWEEIGRGLAGVAALLAAVDIFLNTAKFDKNATSTGIGILLVALAIKSLSKTVKTFSSMRWEEIGKGLAAVGGLLLELGVFLKMASGLKKLTSMGISLLLVAASIKILAGSMTIFSKMNWEEIGKGLVAIGVLLLELMIALNTMPKNLIGIGLGLLLVSSSMAILGNVMAKLGGLTPEELIKSLAGIGVSLLELALALNFMKGTLGASAAMLVASVALTAMGATLKMLSTISWEGLIKGLVAIGGIFLILGLAGELLGSNVGAILALSASLIILGVGVAAIGIGLTLLSTGISSLMASMAIAGKSAELIAAAIFVVVQTVILGIIDLFPAIVSAVVEAIVQIVVALADAAPTLGAALLVIASTLLAVLFPLLETIVDMVIQLLDDILKKIAEHTPSIVQSVMDILFAIVQGIADNIQRIVEAAIDVAVNFIEGVASKLPEIIQAGFDLLLAFIQGITDGIRNNREELMNKFNDLASEIIFTLIYVIVHSFDFFGELGDKLMDEGFLQGIRDTWEKIKEVGGNILKGLWEGISGAFKWVAEKIGGIVEKIKGLFTGKKGFDTHSPSKVFKEIGADTMEGLAIGFQEGGEDVLEGVGLNASEILGKYTSMRDELPGIFDEDFLGVEDPVVSPVLDLDQFESGFSNYTSMIDTMNEMSFSPSFDSSSFAAEGFSFTGANGVSTGGLSSGSYGNYASGYSSYSATKPASQDIYNNTFNNTFNITGDDPETIADMVARIIQERIDRKEAVWA